MKVQYEKAVATQNQFNQDDFTPEPDRAASLLKNTISYKDHVIAKMEKRVDSLRLLIFMQEKLAGMKSKFITKVAFKIKPC